MDVLISENVLEKLPNIAEAHFSASICRLRRELVVRKLVHHGMSKLLFLYLRDGEKKRATLKWRYLPKTLAKVLSHQVGPRCIINTADECLLRWRGVVRKIVSACAHAAKIVAIILVINLLLVPHLSFGSDKRFWEA